MTAPAWQPRMAISRQWGFYPGLPGCDVPDDRYDEVHRWCRNNLEVLGWSTEPADDGWCRFIFHGDDAWMLFRLSWMYPEE